MSNRKYYAQTVCETDKLVLKSPDSRSNRLTVNRRNRLLAVLKRILPIVVGIQLGAVTTALATTWYVNDTSLTGDVYTTAIGNSGNSGTSPAAPLATITQALNRAGSLDIIKVDAGTYAETLSVSVAVTLLGANANNPGPSSNRFAESILASPNQRAIDVRTNNFSLSGFTIQNTPNSSNKSSGVITAGNYYPLGRNLTGFSVTNSIFSNCGTDSAGFAIYVRDGNGLSSNVLIENNKIENTSGLCGGIGVWVAGIGIIIRNNLLKDINQNAIYTQCKQSMQSQSATIRSNSILNCGGGILLEGSTNYSTVIGNTISRAGTRSGGSSGNGITFSPLIYTDNVSIKNNLLDNCNSAGVALSGFGTYGVNNLISLNRFESTNAKAISCLSWILTDSVKAECNSYATRPGGNIVSNSTNTVVDYEPFITTFQYDPAYTDQPGFWPISSTSSMNVTATVLSNALCRIGGSIFVSFDGATAPYTITWNGITTGTTSGSFVYNGADNGNYTINNLPVGIYDVEVICATGCRYKSGQIAINSDPIPFSLSFQATQINCNGGKAAIDLTVNGTGTYTYSWTGPGGFTANTQDIQNLFSGTYAVSVTDTSNGCTSDTTILINPAPSSISVTLTSGSIACYGGSTSATATGSGGTPPFSYLWNTGASSANVSNLIAGSYSCTITDSKGCTGTGTITINQPDPLQVLLTIGSIGCSGGTTTITVNGSGGTSPYSGIGSFTVPAGSYCYTVSDSKGCTAVRCTTVSQPVPVTATLTYSPIRCNGSTTTLTAGAAGGTAPYTYAWSTGETVNSVVKGAGYYCVTARDANGCTASKCDTIKQPSKLTADTAFTIQVKCSGGNDGSVVINATGGTGPYTGTGLKSPLTAGVYNYTVTDALGCTTTTSVTITQPSPLNATATEFQSIRCFGGSGVIRVAASGGTAPYSGTGDFTVYAGTYNYTVTDANGCSSIVSATISNPPLLQITSNPGTIRCFGDKATVVINATGGTAPVTGTGSFLQAAGTICYTVTDARQCTASTCVTLTQPTALKDTITASSIACFGQTATLTSNPSGGTGAYSYRWNTGETIRSVTKPIGTYSVTVSDANLCSITTSRKITQPDQLIAFSTASIIKCFGDSATATITATGGTWPYNGTVTFKVAAGGPYCYTVTDANGCTSQTCFSVFQPTQLTASSTITTPISCNLGTATLTISANGGTPYTTAPAYLGIGTVLHSVGSYCDTVKDANGCKAWTCKTITEPEPLTVLDSARKNVSCNGGNNGSIYIYATGGTPPYSGTGLNPGLAAGSYTYTVTDANACTASRTITINQPSQLVASIVRFKDPSCFNGNDGYVEVGITGGTQPYTIVWNTSPAQSGVIASNLGTGRYIATITDANGCTTTAEGRLIAPSQLTAAASSTPIACFGGTSTVTVTAAGGTPPYSGTGTFIRNAGTYTFTITDAGGCTAITPKTIPQPDSLRASANAGIIACYGGSTTITVSANGGTSPYNGTGSFTVSAGNYTYTVTDFNGCVAITPNTVVSQPPRLTASISYSPILCFGGCTSLNVNAAGGTPPYSISGPGISPIPIGSLVNYCYQAGNYTFTITDAKNCTAFVTITITEPSKLKISTAYVPIKCFGGQTAVTISGSGGTPNYFGTTTTSLGAGTHCFTITDQNGCKDSTCINLTQPSQLVASNSISTPIACFGGNGNVNVSATGGTLPYSGTGGQTVSSGSYSFTVTDGNGCTAVTTGSLSQPTRLVATAVPGIIACKGGKTTVRVDATGGTAPYTGTKTDTVAAGSYCYTVTDANNCTATVCITVTEPDLLVAASKFGTIKCYGGTTPDTILATGGTLPYSGTGIFIRNAGTYSDTVRDNRGCVSIVSSNISQPTDLQISANNLLPVKCFGGSDGSVRIVATGGTPPYTGDGLKNGLAAGNYPFTVTDANGCTKTISVNITQPDKLTSSVNTHQDVYGCWNSYTGSATVSSIGGTRPLTYSWTPASTQRDSSALNLAAGYYTVIVTDANSCTATAGVNIVAPDSITLTVRKTDVTCNLGNDGTAKAAASGGFAPYNFRWSNSALTDSISNLSAGIYTVIVTDASGCTKSTTITIDQATPITISLSCDSINCFGGSTVVTVTASGGNPGYQGTGTFTHAAGNSCFTVTDSRGCTGSKCLQIGQPTRLGGSISSTPINCFGGSSSICANGTGGTLPYYFIWNTGDTARCINKSSGTYSVRITDSKGCSYNDSSTIPQPSQLVVLDSAKKDPRCFGNLNGSVCIYASGGTLPYSGTGCFNGLPANTYTYTVTDSKGCSATRTITLIDPSPVRAVIAYQDSVIGCAGTCTGSAYVQAIGGTPGYSYRWSNGDRTAIACHLCAQAYTVTVTDRNGCSATTGTTILQADTLKTNIVPVQIACNGGSGSMCATTTGGMAPYTYQWNNSATTTCINNLAAGSYRVSVMDDYGCVVGDTDIIQPEPLPVTINYTAPAISCWGGCTDLCITANGGTPAYTYRWNDGSTSNCLYCVRAGKDTVVVTDRNGCQATKCITIGQPDSLRVNLTISPARLLCYNSTTDICPSVIGGTPPFRYRWDNGSTLRCLSGIGAGTYCLTVIDSNNCSATTCITISPAPPALTNYFTTQQIPCSNGFGSICANPSGGVPPYTYSWSNGGTTRCNNNLIAGTYSVTIKDSNGCSLTPPSVTILPPPPPLVINVKVSQILCYGGGGSIDITVSGGTPPYIYAWTKQGQSGTISNLEDIGLLPPGTYCVLVTDANGCTISGCGTINQPPPALNVSASVTQIQCFGGTGCVDASASGGTLPYRYEWKNGTTIVGNSHNLCSLQAGTYCVTVTDTNGCTKSDCTVINPAPSKLGLTAMVYQPRCYGELGSITINPFGGTRPYIYQWKKNGINYSTSKDIASLSAGSYCITLKDSLNCLYDTCISISSAPSQISITKNISQPKCFGEKGSVTLTLSGGTGPYSTSWRTCPCSVVTCQTAAPNPNSMDAGTYYLIVSDANNCSVCDSVIINNAPSNLVVTDSTTQIRCFGETGCVKAISSGGVPPYTYSWKNGTTVVGTNAQVCNLVAGTYCVTVTDANGCTKTRCSTINPAPSLLYVKGTTIQPKCYGDSGCIVLNPFGGTPPYSYKLNNATVTSPACGLLAGNYSIRVTDANGCYKDTAMTINSTPTQLVLNGIASQPKCFGDKGSISQTASGGTLPYRYLWSNGSTSKDITNLAPGVYTCTVSDTNNCTATRTYTINAAPTQLTLICNALQPKCFGEKGCIITSASGGTPPYLVSNPKCTGCTLTLPDTSCGLGAGSYTITVTDANGCNTSTTIQINSAPTAIIANAVTTQISCFGGTGCVSSVPSGGTAPYNYSWKNGTTVIGSSASLCGLFAGTYCLTITDANGCKKDTCVTINTAPAQLVLTASATQIICNGGAACVTASTTGGTSTITYAWKNGTTSIGSTASVCSLTAGTYCVTVTDTKGCTKDTCITIYPAPSAVTVVATATQILCNGGKGSVCATAAGGRGSYTYIWKSGTTVIGNTACVNNLNAGTYCVTAADSSGCVSTSVCVIINAAPSAISISGTVAQPKCSGEKGSICVTGSGGTRPFTFNWSNGSTDSCISNLMAGTYSLLITDANGCTKTSSFNVNQAPSILALNLIETQIKCFGGKGKVVINPSGGTNPYRLSYSGCSRCPLFNPPWSIDTLSAGTYTFTVSDTNGCTQSQNVTISTAPSAITLTDSTIQPGCSYSTGTIKLKVSGGTPSYSFNWSNGATTQDITGLTPGSYSCVVTDQNGCTATRTVTINAIPQPLNITCTVQQPVCYGQKGSISVSVSGGTPSFSYLWNTGATSQNLTNANPGTYSLTVTDSKGCTQNTCCITVNAAPSQLSVGAQVVQPACYGTKGSIDLSVSGGTPTYSYAWSNATGVFSILEDVSNLSQGSYSVQITDANGCTFTRAFTIQGAPAAMSISLNTTQPLCYGDSGAVCALVSGGTPIGIPGYTYSWTTYPLSCNTCLPFANTSCISRLNGGLYTVIATDGNGCTATACANVNYAPDRIQANAAIQQPRCYGEKGCITLNPSGGTAPYRIKWLLDGDSAISRCGLNPGTSYNVSITDANGCTSVIFSISINAAPPALQVNRDVIQPTCTSPGYICHNALGGTPPYTYHWSTGSTAYCINNLPPGTYTDTIRDANGCQVIIPETLYAPSAMRANANLVQPKCSGDSGCVYLNPSGGTAPYIYRWSNGSTNQNVCLLPAGSYSVRVNDNLGCYTDTSFIINQPPSPITSSATITQINCTSGLGKICVNISGGTPPYRYQWNNGRTTSCIDSLAAGNYCLTVTDYNNCTGNFCYTINTAPGPITANATVVQPKCFGEKGCIYLNPLGGTSPYCYKWGTSSSCVPRDTCGLAAGNYMVRITDSRGCSKDTSMSISLAPTPISITSVAPDTFCYGTPSCINVSASGGTAPYTYRWNTGSTGSNYCPVGAGTYTVTVTDANGCTQSKSWIVKNTFTNAVTITASAGPYSATSCVTFTANNINGIPSPVYTWKKNGTAVGSNATYVNCVWGSADVVTCTLSSSDPKACLSATAVTSNSITINVTIYPAKYVICDPTANRVFYYDQNFAYVSSSPLSTGVLNGTTNASDIHCDRDSNKVYVLDGTLNKVYKSNGPGNVSIESSVLRSNTNTGLNPLTGIYVIGKYVYVLDKKGKAVYQFDRVKIFSGLSTTDTALQKLPLNSGNSTAESMTIVPGTTDTIVYVLDNGNSNRLYQYKLASTTTATIGSIIGKTKFTMTSITPNSFSKKLVTNTGANLSKATGIVVDGSVIWVTDNGLDRALGYNSSTLFAGTYSSTVTDSADIIKGLTTNNGMSTGITLVNSNALIRQANPNVQVQEDLAPASIVVNAFPNPTNGRFTLRITGMNDEGSATIHVMDIAGRRIISQAVAETSDLLEHEIDLREQPAGIYLILVEQQDKRQMIRVIKE